MKKWLVTCLLAIALLFVATTAMAAHIRLNGDYCEGNTFEIRKREKDYHTLYCYYCHDEFTENHWSIDTPQYKATCTKLAKCTSCLTSYGEYGPHDWGEWKSSGNGTHTRVCKHNASHAETKDCTFSAASCTEPAACTECGAAYLLGHDWGGWTSNGNKTHTHTCKRDASHTETEACGDFQEANCTTPEMCQDCGGTYGETALDKHAWRRFPNSNGDGTHTHVCTRDDTHKETVSCSGGTATCTEKATCADCGGKYGEKDSDNHTGKKEWTTTKTTHEQKWSCCGEVVVAKESHTFGKWVITKKATFRKDGEKTRTCEVCEYVEKATIQATGSPAKTGDDSHIGMWAGILCVSLAGIIALVVLYKKKHKK